MKNNTKTIKLTKTENTIINGYLKVNKLNGSNQQRITKLCSEGKKGQESIIRMAQYLMHNGESTATLKVQVNRAMGRLKTGLSLQGVGKGNKLTDVTIAPKQKKQGGHGNGKADKVEADKVEATESTTKIMDTESVFDYVVERFNRDDFEALIKAYNEAHKTSLKIAS